MGKPLVVSAPCKVNLSLDITGVRADGYHLLRSVMQTVSLYDYLLISEGDYRGIFIECDREQLSCDTTNTAFGAASAFFQAARIENYSVRLEIIKNIPMQAGLGGGSSDAAATLIGLNRMYQTGFSLEKLCEIGLQVGADVPFCIRGGTVLCEGVGEIFTPLSPLSEESLILIAKPETGLSTVSSFRRYDRYLGEKRHPDTEALVSALEEGELLAVAGSMSNVLEQVSGLPEINRFKELMLSCGALGASMTGSGSAVIGLFNNKRAVRRAHRKLLTEAGAVFITHPTRFGARIVD
ncbi:MAG: 4-(cytidine 5'-diphospho)-2-C-methyl-D-erythritol kinase [Provencibacterium sp.]|nr:4-(cytidine 5'-diphospho)-2-C-methyl-D-erythritol kinase [Provencibacterium sp.]